MNVDALARAAGSPRTGNIDQAATTGPRTIPTAPAACSSDMKVARLPSVARVVTLARAGA